MKKTKPAIVMSLIGLFALAGFSEARTVVNVEECDIAVTVNLAFAFWEDALNIDEEDIVEKWMAGVRDIWNKPGSEKKFCNCPISFEFVTTVMPSGKTCSSAPSEMPNFHCMDVVARPVNGRGNIADATIVSAELPNSYGEWTIHATGLNAAHEVGHMMGLEDEYYRDSEGNWMINSETSENSIMARAWGDVEIKQSHVDKIMKDFNIDCPMPQVAQSAKQVKKIVLVGDIMMDRGVEYFMEKNGGPSYPFEEFKSFSRDKDLVFGNLEGPIVKNYELSSPEAYRFAFAPKTVETLSLGNFNLLSLANNHSSNMGREGLEETRSFLSKEHIAFVGDPIACSLDDAWQTEGLAVMALNKTFPFNCTDEEIAENIQKIRQANPDIFLIISMHWGHEYHLESSVAQQSLAHQMVDSGADLIVGHHPHVVQEIEEYKGKLIFYSLGNFLFDQFFSEDTQQGLVVELSLYPNYIIYKLSPFILARAQPSQMQGEDKNAFLEKLALRSDGSLSEQIRQGIVAVGSESTILNID